MGLRFPEHPRNAGRSILGAVVVSLAIGGLLFLVRGMLSTSGSRCSPRVSCTNNLKNIYGAARIYSNRKMLFPLAAGPAPRAHDSLNVLVASEAGKGLPNKIFVCPASDAEPAVEPASSQEQLVLDENTCSYSWISTETKSFGTPRPLSSDKYYDGFFDGARRRSGHDACMTVLYTDNSVSVVDAAELDPATGLPPGLTR